MQLQLQQQSLLLGRRPAGFTEHYYTEWDDGLGKERISLFLVVSINSTQVPGPEVGKEAFQLLQDHFLDDLTGDPYKRFEAALREINLMINEKEKELDLKFIPNMNVLCGVIQRDNLFLSQRGDAQGYLVRNRHVSSITEGLSDDKNKEDLFQNIASGQLDVDDTVVFSTLALVQYITPSDLSKIFSEQNIKDASKEMKELLDSDLEEQVAMLSFEVLEKVEDLAPVVEEKEEDDMVIDESDMDELEEELEGKTMDSKEHKRLESLRDVKEEEVKKESVSKSLEIPKKVHMDRIYEGLDSLRSWIVKKERWSFLSRFKTVSPGFVLKVVVVLVIVTGLGIAYSVVSGQKAKVLEDLEDKLATAEANLDAAGTRGSFDKEDASNLLDGAESLALEVLSSGQLGGRASELLDEIDVQRNYLDNVVNIDDQLEMLVDFRGLLGSGSIQGVQPYGDEIVVYTQNEAYEVLIDQAQSPSSIDSTERVIAGQYFEDRDVIIMLTAGGNVIEYDSGNAQFADTSDVDWVTGVDIDTYGSRAYILDPSSSQIWKYTRGSSSYGGGSAYLDADEDVSDGVSMAIDGSVWVLHDDGRLSKYLSGESVDYDIVKPPLVAMDGATAIYTELEISQLYVLDPDLNRLLIFTKNSKSDDISYDSQYVFDDLVGTLQDFYWDKERDVMVIVTDTALYELDI